MPTCSSGLSKKDDIGIAVGVYFFGMITGGALVHLLTPKAPTISAIPHSGAVSSGQREDGRNPASTKLSWIAKIKRWIGMTKSA
jgi:hypothetical protein